MMTQETLKSASLRERVGVSLSIPDIVQLLDTIDEAEARGVAQLWMTQRPDSIDALSIYAAAFGRTQYIRLGTSIVPTYPRHPLALAQQAATVSALGAGRLRLGIGPSHRPIIEHVYGIQMEAPLVYLEEYLGVLREVLWNGHVEHQGRFITARTTAKPQPVPLLISALGENAFRLAGQIADGAISWNCPPNYLLDRALPALAAGAREAGRARPPLVAHACVALSDDHDAVRAAAHKALAGYVKMPFYTNMFVAAGYPLTPDGTVSDALVDALVIAGDTETVAARIRELLAFGLDELLLTPLGLDDPAGHRSQLFELIGGLG